MLATTLDPTGSQDVDKQKNSRSSELFCAGDDLFSRRVAPQLSSALIRFTIQFGMGWSGSVSLKTPAKRIIQKKL